MITKKSIEDDLRHWSDREYHIYRNRYYTQIGSALSKKASDAMVEKARSFGYLAIGIKNKGWKGGGFPDYWMIYACKKTDPRMADTRAERRRQRR